MYFHSRKCFVLKLSSTIVVDQKKCILKKGHFKKCLDVVLSLRQLQVYAYFRASCERELSSDAFESQTQCY